MIKEELICPHCKNDDQKMITLVMTHSTGKRLYLCEVCSKGFEIK